MIPHLRGKQAAYYKTITAWMGLATLLAWPALGEPLDLRQLLALQG